MTRLHRLRRLRGLVALGLGVVTVACGGGDDGRSSGTTAPATSAETTAPPAPSTSAAEVTTTAPPAATVRSYPVPAGSRPHDVWAASDGTVWYTGQAKGVLGVLDPTTGELTEVPLGGSSRPHGVIEGPDGAAWITDGGLNAIVRVDTATGQMRTYPLPAGRAGANLNTAAFDDGGTLWFTGQSGVYGRLPPGGAEVEVFDAPGGRGPYGITTVAGAVYYASLAGSHIARVDPATGDAAVLPPPTADQGTRRVWADSTGRIWSSQWNAGQVAVYDPGAGSWREWRLPGESPQAYAVYVDERDVVWLSDFGANALVSFDPAAESFASFPLPSAPGEVRQIHGRGREVWGAESAADSLVVVTT